MCRTCKTFTQLRDALSVYDQSAINLHSTGYEAAAERDYELSAAIRGELHVYDRSGRADEEILWMES